MNNSETPWGEPLRDREELKSGQLVVIRDYFGEQKLLITIAPMEEQENILPSLSTAVSYVHMNDPKWDDPNEEPTGTFPQPWKVLCDGKLYVWWVDERDTWSTL